MNQKQMIKDLGISPVYLDMVRKGKREGNTETLNALAMLESYKPKYDSPIVVYGSTLILFDAQVPFQDGDFILALLKLAKAWGVKQGILGGDFFNEAAFSIFSHPPEDMSWHEEAQIASNIGKTLKEYVPSWCAILGNHDAFLLKKLGHQLGHQDLFKLADIPDVVTSDYYWCLVKDKQGNVWRISHPRNVSVAHGGVPRELALKYQQNVISGHGHLAGMGFDKSGKFLCIDAGVCCDPAKLDYSEQRDSTRPKMNQGAVILKEIDGVIKPYHILPDWVDWDALHGLYE